MVLGSGGVPTSPTNASVVLKMLLLYYSSNIALGYYHTGVYQVS